MDTTETNIKMCEKAWGIQEQAPEHLTDNGRFKYTRFGEYKFVRVGGKCNDEGFYEGYKLIWLPCQDQLQEMVKYFYNMPPAEYSARGLLEVFWNFVDEHWVDYLWTMSDEQVSMEQLWLAFVMKEKYNKVWNGENWIDELP